MKSLSSDLPCIHRKFRLKIEKNIEQVFTLLPLQRLSECIGYSKNDEGEKKKAVIEKSLESMIKVKEQVEKFLKEGKKIDADQRKKLRRLYLAEITNDVVIISESIFALLNLTGFDEHLKSLGSDLRRFDNEKGERNFHQRI